MNDQYARTLTDIIGLVRLPVAVSFLSAEVEIPADYRSDLSLTYCQHLMMAQKGEKIAVTADNLACANGAAALGLRPLPEKIARGEMTYQLGVFADPAFGARLSQQTPRIPQGQYKGLLLAPLAAAEFEPDLVIIQGTPFNIMWILMANNFNKGDRGSFSTAVSQGICVDVTVIPLLTGNVNISLGCYGSRNATDEQHEEMLAGIPFALLPNIIEALPRLNDKVIDRTTRKPAYHRLATKMEWE